MPRSLSRPEKLLFLVPLPLVGLGVYLSRPARVPDVLIPYPDYKSRGDVRFSPDGKHLLLDILESGLVEGEIYDVATGKREAQLPKPNKDAQMMTWDWAPDGQRITAAFSNGYGKAESRWKGSTHPISLGLVTQWNALDGKLLKSWSYAPSKVCADPSIRYSVDGKRLIGNGAPPTIFDAENGTVLARYRTAPPLRAVHLTEGSFSADESLVALSVDEPRKMQVVETKTHKAIWKPDFILSENVSMMWTFDQHLLCREDSPQSTVKVHFWNSKTRLEEPSPPVKKFTSLKPNPRLPLLAILYGNRDVENSSESGFMVWDYQERRIILNLPFIDPEYDYAWSPDGEKLALLKIGLKFSQKERPVLRVFDASGNVRWQRDEMQLGEEIQPQLRSITWTPDSKRLAIVNLSGIQLVTIP